MARYIPPNEEGFEAWKAGKKRSDNPYSDGKFAGSDQRQWDNGWLWGWANLGTESDVPPAKE